MVIPPDLSVVLCPSAEKAVEMLNRFVESGRTDLFFSGLETTGCVQISDREIRMDAILAQKLVKGLDGQTSRYRAFSGMSERGRNWGIVDASLLARQKSSGFARFAADHMVDGLLRLPIGLPAAWSCRKPGDAVRLLGAWQRAPRADILRRSGCFPLSGPIAPRAILARAELKSQAETEMDGAWFVLRVEDARRQSREVLYWSSWERP
jgi:hypothetical protein